MFSRKLLLLVLAAGAVAAAAGVYYVGKLHFEASRASTGKLSDNGFRPSIPDAPPMLLMDEKTGQVWQFVKRDPKTHKINTVSVGFVDGRRGEYNFENGKLKSYVGFDENNKPHYEANYDAAGLITDYKLKDEFGKLKTTFRRLAEGAEEMSFFDAKGNCIKKVVTARDGSQTVTEQADPGKEAKVTQIKAESSEKGYGELSSTDGTGKKLYRFKFNLSGARINSWEYRDAAGKQVYNGKFTENGNVEVTFIDTYSRPVLRQTWVCIGEDWNRRYYRLTQIEKLNSWSSEPEGTIVLYPDGVTPKEITSTTYGTKSTDFFNERGIKERTEYYDTNGFPNGYYYPGYQQPQGQGEKVVLPPQLIAEPSDKDGPSLRLRGNPYTSPLPSEGQTLSPMFVLPK